MPKENRHIPMLSFTREKQYRLGYMPGVWDMIHVGHLNAIRLASSLCNKLIVGVASDSAVREDKGQLPVVPLLQRLEMIEALPEVTLAFAYHRLDFVPHLVVLEPSVAFLPEDWGHETRHLDLERWAANNGCHLYRVPRTQGVSTTDLRRKL